MIKTQEIYNFLEFFIVFCYTYYVKKGEKMSFYSDKQINIISLIITICIFIIITMYIPKLYTTVTTYFYYKNQPKTMQEYE